MSSCRAEYTVAVPALGVILLLPFQPVSVGSDESSEEEESSEGSSSDGELSIV